jgi:hypothetical protein
VIFFFENCNQSYNQNLIGALVSIMLGSVFFIGLNQQRTRDVNVPRPVRTFFLLKSNEKPSRNQQNSAIEQYFLIEMGLEGLNWEGPENSRCCHVVASIDKFSNKTRF